MARKKGNVQLGCPHAHRERLVSGPSGHDTPRTQHIPERPRSTSTRYHGVPRRDGPRYVTEHTLSASRNAAGGYVASSETAKTYAPRAPPRESKRARWSADFTVMTARTGNDRPEGSKAMTPPKPALPTDQGASPPGRDILRLKHRSIHVPENITRWRGRGRTTRYR